MSPGVKLAGVTAGSPADKAGVQAGDIIVEFGGKPVKDIYDYTNAIGAHKPGDVVTVVVMRAGHTARAHRHARKARLLNHLRRLMMHRRSFLTLLALATLASVPLAAQDSSLAAPGTFVLRAAHLIDGTGSAEVQNAAIVVIGDSITWVGSAANVKAPAGARTIDLGDATLLPGFIDAHVHLAGRELGDPEQEEAAVHDYDQYSAILGVNHAKSTLLDGFTSVRNVGAPNFDDMALRKAINASQIWGPRMENAGYAIGITGGHCDENGYKPGLFDGSIKTGIAERARPGARRRALHGQARRGRDQDVRDRRRALRGRCGGRVAVHLRRAAGDGRRGERSSGARLRRTRTAPRASRSRFAPA